MEDGMTPVMRVYPKHNTFMFVKRPKDVGIVPRNGFMFARKKFRLVR